MLPPVNRSHASAPSITASDTSIAPGTQAGKQRQRPTGLDRAVQHGGRRAASPAPAGAAALCCRRAACSSRSSKGLGAVGEVLVRSYGATAAQATAALQSDRQIAWFEADSLKQIDAAVPNDAQFSQQWALDNTGQNGGTPGDDIDATQAWNITTGSRNVVVAVIDSGVDYTDPDLAANIWTNPNAGQDGFSGDVHGYNFVDNNGNPMDDNGHGTFVAGEIGAVGNNGVGVAGVDWNVTIMPLKFLDADGDGYTSDAIRAINYATMERTQYGVNVRVINASWSSSQSDPGLERGDPGGRQRRDPLRRRGGKLGEQQRRDAAVSGQFGPAERRLRGRQRFERPARLVQRLRGQHGQPGRAGRRYL